MKSYTDVAYLLIGGRSVIPQGPTVIRDNSEHLLQEVTGANEEDDRWEHVGVKTFEMTQEGFFDHDTGSWHEALEEKESILMYAPIGNEKGDELIALAGVRSIYNRLPSRGEFHKANATYKAEAGPERIAKIIAILTERTALSDETTIYDWGALSEKGGAIYLSVTALTLGGTKLTIALQHKPAAEWVDLGDPFEVTEAPYAERQEIIGTIAAKTRVRWEFQAGNGQSATFTVGLARR